MVCLGFEPGRIAGADKTTELWQPPLSNYLFCFFKNGPAPASFCLFSFFTNTILQKKNSRLQRDLTRIVGVESEHAVYLTTTTAHQIN